MNIKLEDLQMVTDVMEEVKKISIELVSWMERADKDNKYHSSKYGGEFYNVSILSNCVNVIYEECYYGDSSDYYDHYLPFKCFTGGIKEYKKDFLLEIEKKKLEIEKEKQKALEIKKKDEEYEIERERELYEKLKIKFGDGE